MDKQSSFIKTDALQRFLERLPEDVACSFSIEQLQAMQSALEGAKWRRHPVDIRLTIPLLWKSFYFVLVAGPERRSKERRVAERTRNPVWRFSNLLFTMTLICFGMLMALGIFQLQHISFNALGDVKTHPAGIPFKEDQKTCEESGRVWRSSECIDYEHDPTF